MVDWNQYHNKKIAMSALDWGMGHMTRLVTLMQKLKGIEWIIAATKTEEPYYKHYFPQATFVNVPPLGLQWSGNKPASQELFGQKKLCGRRVLFRLQNPLLAWFVQIMAIRKWDCRAMKPLGSWIITWLSFLPWQRVGALIP